MSDPASAIWELLLFWPFSLPYQFVEAGPPPPCGWSFAAASYAQLADGYLEPARCALTWPEASEQSPQRLPGNRSVAGQASLDGLASVDGSYARVAGRVRLLTTSRVEFDAAYGDYFGLAGRTSPGWLGQTHLEFRFAQSQRDRDFWRHPGCRRLVRRSARHRRVLLRLVEAYVGWDALWLGSRRHPTEDLGGSVLGAGAYF
jgi:hypothetical protein